MTGQIYKNTPVTTDNEFVPAWLVMACYMADLPPCGLLYTYGNMSELGSGSWITVIGILYGEQYRGQEELRFRVISVVPAKPIEGYIPPYSQSLADWDGGYWFRQMDFQSSLSLPLTFSSGGKHSTFHHALVCHEGTENDFVR